MEKKIKTPIKIHGKWLDYPKHSPELGETIIVGFAQTDISKLTKIEIVEWTFKMMDKVTNAKSLTFKFLRLPPL